MTTPLQLDELLTLPPEATRQRATWVYGALRFFLDVPAASRTEQFGTFTAAIDSHPRGLEEPRRAAS